MNMKMKERTIGTQAPSLNLMSAAEKYSASMVPKNTMKPIARNMLLFQHEIITRDIRHVVTSMTVITANPAQGVEIAYE
jgi:hypothetical protein